MTTLPDLVRLTGDRIKLEAVKKQLLVEGIMARIAAIETPGVGHIVCGRALQEIRKVLVEMLGE